MKNLATQIDIEASPERVWEVLTDLDHYATWNPFIVEAQGLAASGSQLRLRMSPPGGRTVTLKPKVTTAVPGVLLEWLGRLPVPFLFAGRHRFELHPTSTGTRVVHSETFTGMLVPFLARSLDAHTQPGFTAMNEALKAQAETVPLATV
jgi:hypothetical protein